MDPSSIQENMEVVGSDGGHVGVVDHVEGQRIKLTKTDPVAQDHHHYIGLDLVASVEGGAVRLTRTAAEVINQWQSDARGVRPGSPNAGP